MQTARVLIDKAIEFLTFAVTGPFTAVTVVAGAFALTRVARFAIRRIIRRLSRRSGGDAASMLWRPRSLRLGGEDGDVREHRRRQRVDAAARMVSHLASVVIWILATIVLFHLLDVDPAFFLSSAGFIGAGLAIGGQHKVNDYLTGLSVHFEDRYGVGDEIVAEVGWDVPMRGVVDHVGLFSTRVRDVQSTMHFPNHALTSVRNLSQETPAATLHLDVPDGADTADLLRRLAGTDGLTDVVFVGDLDVKAAAQGGTDVDVRTSRHLDDGARERLVSGAEHILRRR